MSKRLFSVSLLVACLLGFINPTSVWAQIKIEAEAGSQYVQLTQANINSNNGVTYAENLIQTGSAVAFTVSVPTAGVYTVTSRYAAAREYNWTMSVYVNSIDVAQAQFATTASWMSWSTQSVTVALLAGTNIIKYQYDADDSGWVNLDYITVSPATTPGFSAGSAVAGALPTEIGVNKFTGTATFDAPLYTITIPGFSLPIALHYTADGVQAEDTGGEIGINWSLQAGYGIHRQVRDLPDDVKVEDSSTPERRYGWLRYPSGSPASRIGAVPNVPATISTTGCTTAEQNALSQLNSLGSLSHNTGYADMYDTEPDVFTYSIPGYSGKFVFDETGNVRLLPYAPIQIIPSVQVTNVSCGYPVPTGELTGFTIKTAEGISYSFTVPERISCQTQSTAPYGGTKYSLRQFWNFRIRANNSGSYNGPVNLDYTTGWLVTQIVTPAAATNLAAKIANSISFNYDCTSYIPIPATVSKSFLLGNSANYPTNDYAFVSRTLSNPKLAAIISATAVATFSRELDESDNFHVTALTITSPQEQGKLLKAYAFKYHTLGRFLTQVTLNRANSTLPLYLFTYGADIDAGTSQPVSKQHEYGINEDYWGFVNNNGASTGVPRLYAYPQLLSATNPVPAAPYRLYPIPAYQNGEIVLVGADRRPPNRLSVALAGTLTEVTFATGGKVALEYEQNQFYDPVAQQSLPAGGLRIRTIKLQDPITKVETRRDYNYQQTSSGTAGMSSGVLLHLPRFAFAMPLTTSTQWADVTVRSTEDLAPDPFESRVVGYRQVTESVPGKGQVITTFSSPGGADDNISPAGIATDLPTWQRPIFGVARQASGGNCPTVTPLQAVGELYPFAPAPNYDFCRGLPVNIQYRAEPTSSTSPGDLLRQEDFSYQYINARPSFGTSVTGLRYEQLGNPSTPEYAYAKYSLLTDYLYVTKQQVTSQFIAGSATNQTTTSYRYNAQGWLAAKIVLGSDNTLTRTRYKYLSDYQLPTSGASGALQAMGTRSAVNGEGITSDLVETISEIRPAGTGGHVLYAGATLQTFATSTIPDPSNNNAPITTPTYPSQLRRWQPAQPVASYDSVRIVNNTLYIPTALRLASTVQEVDMNLTPLSLRAETGRQVASKHVGYGGIVPVLQINNAAATEVVFSDFEDNGKPYAFINLPNGSATPSTADAAARTGQRGLLLVAGSSIATQLPTSTAPQYRLIYWVRSATAATSTVAIASNQGTVFTQSVAHSGSGQWQRCEMLLPLANLTNRASYQLTISADGSNTLHVDDVLLLPADASATSTTYVLANGKTSETDARGRTTYYEYSLTGDLALVRDHNKAIMHQYRKALPGQTIVAGISFIVTGTMKEGDPITFTATASLAGVNEYKWDFGDGTVISYPANTQVTHIYPITGQSNGYTVRLYVKNQGAEYLSTQVVGIFMQPLVLTNCMAGLVAFDDCSHCCGQQIDTQCNPNVIDPQHNTFFQVTPNLTANLTYEWECIDRNNPTGQWQPISGGSPTITIASTASRLTYRCKVSSGTPTSSNYQQTISDEFIVRHYKSDPNCP